MAKTICFFLSMLLFCGIATAQNTTKLTEQQKIEQLIVAIEQLKDAEFIRGGKAYSAPKAASHLRMKLGKAGDRVKTAKDFIDGVASSSYLSGKPYYIRFKDGRQVTSKEFFEAKLKEMEK